MADDPKTTPPGLGRFSDRNLEMWRRWKGGETRASLARGHGISSERVRQIVENIEWCIRREQEAGQ